MLDVHALHQPVRTWKDFFVHIATIVIGLLIAIGLEQTVEYFHHRHEVREARKALAAEHVFGTLKSWMGATHFLMKRLPNVRTEMSLHVLAYNLKRAMQILGVVPLMKAMRA